MNTFSKALLIVLVGCACTVAGVAQPVLTLRSVVGSWPTVKLHVGTRCNGQSAINMQKQDFRITENDIPITEFTLSCPEDTGTSPISVALVFDASGSMGGSGNAGAKLAGRAFVDRMDGIVDEAAIIWFTSVVNNFQQMTTIKPLLYSAVDALPASGATAVWDGAFGGIIEVINNGVNPCRAVVVLTDGGDNSSTRTPAEIIDLAKRNGVRVYTIGLGSSINATELEMIALLTGGRYYQTPNAGQLAALYQEVFADIRNCGNECVITYDADCADGGVRLIEVTLDNFCGGSISQRESYVAPLDTTDYQPVYMRLAGVHEFAGGEITVPLMLNTILDTANFHPLEFRLVYDTTHLEFKGISAPVGSLIEGMPFSVVPVSPVSLRINSLERKVIIGNGLLAELSFAAKDVDSIVCSDLRVEAVTMTRGCMKPVIDCDRICLYPAAGSILRCAIDAPEIDIDLGTMSYKPMPVPVTVTVTNSGAIAADNLLVTLNLDEPYTLEFAAPDSPATATKALAPAGPLAPGSSATATWLVQHPVVDTPANVWVRAVVNAGDTKCEKQLQIPGLNSSTFKFQLYAAKPLEFCEGLSVLIDAPGGYERYLWSTGDTLRSIHARVSGPYFCTAWYNGQIGFSDTLYVNVLPAPKPIIAVTGSIPLCPGDSLVLDAGPGYSVYYWNTREISQSVVVHDAGEYWVNVTGGNGCPGVSDTVTVVMAPAAEKPRITRDLDVLTSTTARSWQWYRNGQPLTGESNQTLQLMQTGTYVVFITDENGCTAMSDPFDVTVLNIDVVGAVVQRFDLFPNPVRGSVSLNVDLDRPQAVTISVSDMLGRVHHLQRFTAVTQLRRQLDISGYAPGNYIVRLSLARGSISRILTVQ